MFFSHGDVAMFEKHVRDTLATELGQVIIRNDIKSSMGPFRVLPDYVTVYPPVVIEALGQLYLEYNSAFGPIASKNREWEEDYRYCLSGGSIVNWMIQIDMVGLPQTFLDEATDMSVDQVREILRYRIFEIENSLAMYQFINKIHATQQESFFEKRFRLMLDYLRFKFDKKIALLAVTDEKWEGMKTSEFGKGPEEHLSDQEVFALSGFDRFFGPREFGDHLRENNGECRYLLYARTSDPVAKLKKPETIVHHPLLSDERIRKIIRAHSLTLNVDDPTWKIGDQRRINDTKVYLPPMQMAFLAQKETDFLTGEFIDYLMMNRGGAKEFFGQRLSPGFVESVQSMGFGHLDQAGIGELDLRAKPAQGTYGCYGHTRGKITDSDFRVDLRTGLRRRGPYVIQPEMSSPRIANTTNGENYSYIDRNFLAIMDGQPRFLGGFRSMMPIDSLEVARGRNHGSNFTVSAEIRSA